VTHISLAASQKIKKKDEPRIAITIKIAIADLPRRYQSENCRFSQIISEGAGATSNFR